MTTPALPVALKDYSPTRETISLHGLGFIQVKLPANRRLHVWHPDLPRRDCFAFSAIHNHRFAFRSTVLVGRQMNQRCDLVIHPEGSHDVISHDGPRSDKGGRESFVAGRVNVVPRPVETYLPGESYEMRELEYHSTPNEEIVVTLMQKLSEGHIHACSVIERPHVFHQAFDRFQWAEERLWQCVVQALGGAALRVSGDGGR
jgi:hypothetical protein